MPPTQFFFFFFSGPVEVMPRVAPNEAHAEQAGVLIVSLEKVRQSGVTKSILIWVHVGGRHTCGKVD